MDPVNVPAKFEVRSFTRSWDNREYLKSLSSPWICPRFHFTKIFNGLLFGWTRWMYRQIAEFKVRSFTRSWDNSGYLKNFGQSMDTPFKVRWSSKVVDIGTNRKRVCDFLLVRNSNPGPILHRFGDIAGFLALQSEPTPIPPQFWGCIRCTRWPMLGSARSLKLFGREIIFEEFQPIWSRVVVSWEF